MATVKAKKKSVRVSPFAKGAKTISVKAKKLSKKTSSKKSKKSALTMTEQVEKVLDTLRPYLISDGGNIELLGVDETHGIVTVHLVGACASCSSAQVTLYAGVEKTLKEKIPQINALIAV